MLSSAEGFGVCRARGAAPGTGPSFAPCSSQNQHPQRLAQNQAPSFASVTNFPHLSLQGLGFDLNLWRRLLFMAILVSTDLFSPGICSMAFPRDGVVAFHLGDLMVRTGLPRATLCRISFTFFTYLHV